MHCVVSPILALSGLTLRKLGEGVGRLVGVGCGVGDRVSELCNALLN